MTADIHGFYAALGVDLPQRGKQAAVTCFINPDAHSHGDKTKSMSVSLQHGAYQCKSCGAKGGAFDAAVALGKTPREAMDLLRTYGLTDKPPPAKHQNKATGRRTSQPQTQATNAQPEREPESKSSLKATELDVTRWQKTLLADEQELARLGELRGWTTDTLEALDLGYDGERVTIPVRAPDGNLIGICRYQPDPERRGAEQPKMKADAGSVRELFPAPETLNGDGPVLLLEGETCVPLAASLGLAAVGYPGLGVWRSEWSSRFQGRKVCLIPDASEKGRAKAREVAHDLYGPTAEVRILDLHPADRTDDADLTDWARETGALASQETRSQAAALLVEMMLKAPRFTRGATRAKPVTLPEVVAAYRRWLYLPDSRPLLAALGAAAANYLDGDPVWLLLVGASGSGKTQIVEPLRRLPAVHPLTTLTEAALLSGTSSKDRETDATGGLLREMGTFGILLFKDFTSVLSMEQHSRDRMLAALREVYDGHYTRSLGTDGGRKFYWPSKDGPKGKVGVIGGVTDAIDDKAAVAGSMGERLLLFRLPRQDPRQMTMAALGVGTDNQTRDEELERVVQGLFAYGPPREPVMPSMAEREELAALAMLCAYCRSGVQRDRMSREVDYVNDAEVPTRLARALQQLLLGLSALGIGRRQAFAIVAKVAIDSMPGVRAAVLAELLKAGDAHLTTSMVAAALRRSDSKSVRRALEDLELHGILEASHGGQGVPTEWRTSLWVRPFAALTMAYPTSARGGKETSGEPSGKLMDDIRGVDLPTNPLEIALSGALGSAWDETFPLPRHKDTPSENGSSPSNTHSSSSSYTKKQDAGKAELSLEKPLGNKRFPGSGGTPRSFREVSPRASGEGDSLTAEAWIEQDGWRLSEDQLVDALFERFGIAAEDSYPLVDLAYDCQKQRA